jgi:UDP-N-acetylglucosamine 2-epimerase
MITALETSGREVLYTYPNADPGSGIIRRKIIAAVARNPHHHAVANLGPKNFYAALANAGAVIGNSSAGIIEAASFQLPVINIGNRQAGRFTGQNVIHVGTTHDDIAAGLKTAFDSTTLANLEHYVNPYGDGQARFRIADVIERILSAPLAPKRFFDYEATSRFPALF